MLRKFVTVRNVSGVLITIRDRRFSHGKLDIAAGEEYGLPNDIWMDHRRRYIGRLVDVSTLAPVVEAIPFKATHIFRDEPVMLVSSSAKRVYFDKCDGSNSWAKTEDWAEAVEISTAQPYGLSEAEKKGNDDENTI